ncbi:DUF2568 domain-containing protein [Frankia sp. CcWB3]
MTLAGLLPLLTAGIWGRWLAPRAARRLGQPSRLAVKLALFVATAMLRRAPVIRSGHYSS